MNPRKQARLKRKKRIRKKISGSPERPRLSVFRSSKHIYAQLIDDDNGVT
ncbi:MAG: 50S ribosomal protein L18, partial [Syntrophobacterales bacterium]